MLAVHQRLNNNAIYGDPATTAPASLGGDSCLGGGDPDTAAYHRYLSSSHLVDGPAVLRALRRLLGAAGETGASGWRRPTVVHGRPASLLERSVAALLTGDEPVVVRTVKTTETGGAPGQVSADKQEEQAGTEHGTETGECQEDESGERGKQETGEGQGTGTRQEATGGAERELELVRTVWHCVDVSPHGGAADAASPTDAHITNMFSEYRMTSTVAGGLIFDVA